MELFTVEDVSFTYPDQDKAALNRINFTIEQGEYISICGPSGCGKSTLLRHLKPVLTPYGNREGNIFFQGKDITKLTLREQAKSIGYVLQNPDNQIVTDKVWHELAFGLESLGLESKAIRLRTAEMASFFGIEEWFYKKVTELSGGQKQLLNLASIMAMQPEVLILDEPTSQLDPIAASDFLKTVYRINRELGTTVILTEHRMEETFPSSDRILVMDEGRILLENTPTMAGKKLKEYSHRMFLSMPTPMQIYGGVKNDLECPLTIRDGRQWIDKLYEKNYFKKDKLNKRIIEKRDEIAIELREIWFRYDKEGADIIKDLSLKVPKGSHYCIMGGNGAGKTTALSIISGINRPYRGKVLINGKDIKKQKNLLSENTVGVLPQNPQSLFVKKTVELDLLEILSESMLTKVEKVEAVKAIAKKVDIEAVLQMHPYDLSGGEQQRAAIAKVLLLQPDILLLDEPTKGMDKYLKNKLAKIIQQLIAEGKTVITVSHDIEFCAEFADQCALVFQGSVVTENNTREFFQGNSFYTTAANRMARHLFPDVVTIEDVIQLCQ
ncbi:MAG TPA: cobalt ABC transporter ATP-binding protein [Lachnospiraceae bacterium]|uniref:ABC transporter ATP-binding protein n=1 Tax=Anaerosporobacter sp. TaxID=1872529 RepID=UPI000EDCCE67|nr:energy-coupling factor transporter ATPase [Anaerosporobacter sp.]HAB60688.1 cobalt ABC transporter ATP-binding protein [Lachnospiraceae bacterium]